MTYIGSSALFVQLRREGWLYSLGRFSLGSSQDINTIPFDLPDFAIDNVIATEYTLRIQAHSLKV